MVLMFIKTCINLFALPVAEETCPSETDNPPQLLERSTFQQQVAIFAPTLLPVHTMLPSLLRDLQAGDGAVRYVTQVVCLCSLLRFLETNP